VSANPVAIVTGASRGIGRTMALSLARAGHDVVIAAKTETPHARLPGTIHEVAREVESLGRRALAVRTDVRELDDIEALAARTLKEFGRIDVAVHNAGAIWLTPVLETPLKRLDLVLEVNARAGFALSQAAAKAMLAGAGGHIVIVAPPIELDALPGRVAYAISKFGLTMLMQGFAEELRGKPVSINALWPATAVRSSATETFGMGTPEQWRTPEIMGDALVELVATKPGAMSGRALLDEDWLRERGWKDFAKYQCVPGKEPPRLALRDYPRAGRATE